MTDRKLKLISYLYLIIPVIIFIMGWIKIVFSIPITICLLVILKLLYNKSKENTEIINSKYILPILLFVVLICITAGHGGVFYQSPDWDARNAIFRDLIKLDWPVYYEQSNSALTYYIGQWMVPSIIGKSIVFIANIINKLIPNTITKIINYTAIEYSFYIGNIALLIWNSIGVLLAVLWLIKILRLKEKKSICKAIFIFLFFSGLDILGMSIFGTFSVFLNRIHLEWWAVVYQFSSMITQLFWVFNQSIPIWIITLMFLEEKRVNNYLVLILLALPFAPLPFIGLVIIFACNGIKFLINSIKNKEKVKFVKDVFSMQNILALISILPIYACFYSGNASTSGNSDGGGFSFMLELITPFELLKLFIFWFLEIGIYGLFLFKTHKKNPLFYTIMISLLIIPLFQLGYEYDFSMRVSIPLILIINLLIVREYLNISKNKKEKAVEVILLTIVLCIGLVTPICEYGRAFYCIAQTGKINLVYDKTKTYSNLEDVSSNFVTKNPKENSIFFKYIAK